MTLQNFIDNGFILRSWFITTVHGDRTIAVKLAKMMPCGRSHNFITRAPCSEKTLKTAEFIQPILLDDIARV